MEKLRNINGNLGSCWWTNKGNLGKRVHENPEKKVLIVSRGGGGGGVVGVNAGKGLLPPRNGAYNCS